MPDIPWLCVSTRSCSSNHQYIVANAYTFAQTLSFMSSVKDIPNPHCQVTWCFTNCKHMIQQITISRQDDLEVATSGILCAHFYTTQYPNTAIDLRLWQASNWTVLLVLIDWYFWRTHMGHSDTLQKYPAAWRVLTKSRVIWKTQSQREHIPMSTTDTPTKFEWVRLWIHLLMWFERPTPFYFIWSHWMFRRYKCCVVWYAWLDKKCVERSLLLTHSTCIYIPMFN